MSSEAPKSIRLQVLVDAGFRGMVSRAAHESWMSVGQYMREIVSLMEGADFDAARDWVMIGKEIGLDAFEALRDCAERRGQTIDEYCRGLRKKREDTPVEHSSTKQENDSSTQLSLF